MPRAPPIEPIVIPKIHDSYEMTPGKGNKSTYHGYSEYEPVSPLSPHSQAILLKHQNSVRKVSPQTSPVGAQLPGRSQKPQRRPQQMPTEERSQPLHQQRPPIPRDSYPPAHIRKVPPRKAVETAQGSSKGKVIARKPMVINNSAPRQSVYASYGHVSRPRSQSVHEAIPESFLQDFADHAISTHVDTTQRPRSQSFAPPTSHQRQIDQGKATCAYCGKRQRNARDGFFPCPICPVVSYCSTSCWEARVCHRSITCLTCGLTRPSGSAGLVRCRKCRLDFRKESWFCNEKCFGDGRCHPRSPPGRPPVPPPKVQLPRRVDTRRVRTPRDIARVQGQRDLRPIQTRNRDLEAQKKPYHQNTRISGIVWAVAIGVMLLVIVLVSVLAKKG